MKRFCMLVGLAGVLAVPAVQAQMQVTLYQDINNYSDNIYGGEFRAVPDAALLHSVNPTLAGYTAYDSKFDGSIFSDVLH